MDQQTTGLTPGVGIRASWLSSPYAIAAILFIGALLLRLAGIGERPPKTDELYHLLAARSWADNGTLAIAEGEYLRARGYTIATGMMYELFGVHIGAGRALAALGAALQVAALAFWVRRIANAPAAWIAGLLLLFSHENMMLGQFARFYTWHAALLWFAAMAAYALAHGDPARPRWRTAALVATLLLGVVLAMHLQDTTAIMVVALAAWGGVAWLISPASLWLRRSPRLMILGGAVIALTGAFALLAAREPLLTAWQKFRHHAVWAEGNSTFESYYLWLLSDTFGWLFTLLPVAVLLAWRSYRHATLFCAVILLVGLALHSLAGMKSLRYVQYLLPFLFAIWAFAVAVAAPHAPRILSGGWEWSAWPRGIQAFIRAGIALVVAGAALVGTPDMLNGVRASIKAVKTGSIVMAGDYPPGAEEVGWTPWLPALRPLLDRSIVITADENRTLYYLGGFDVLLNKTILYDFNEQEFARDHRTGKLGISTGASIARLMGCYPSGVILVPEKRWRSHNVTDDAADMIERSTRRVALPPDYGIRAYVWDRPAASPASSCPALRAQIRARADRAGSAAMAP